MSSSSLVEGSSSIVPSTTLSSATNVQSGAIGGGAGGGNGGGNGSSSPLLFFVALGFGVVFTNLWIIVGVKYCFRYNRRNRALRAHVDGDQVDLTVMPHPHRRRREKKLMTAEEVNTKFPLVKYKAWRSTRDQKGLHLPGGITSMKDVDDISACKSQDMMRPDTALSATAVSMAAKDLNYSTSRVDIKEVTPAGLVDKVETIVLPAIVVPSVHEETISEKLGSDRQTKKLDLALSNTSVAEESVTDDEDIEGEGIEHAMSHEAQLAAQSGDTCAICLDYLEEDDDVRGLACGHAFHAVCLDPWLTSRRACCPLCKADYHIPKPKSGGEGGNITSAGRRPNTSSMRLPTNPPNIWLNGRSRLFVLGINRSEDTSVHGSSNRMHSEELPARQERSGRRRFINFRWPCWRNHSQNPQTTPSQLEAASR